MGAFYNFANMKKGEKVNCLYLQCSVVSVRNSDIKLKIL